jgi:hypothetical protein
MLGKASPYILAFLALAFGAASCFAQEAPDPLRPSTEVSLPAPTVADSSFVTDPSALPDAPTPKPAPALASGSQPAAAQSGTAQNPTAPPSTPPAEQQDQNTKRILGIIPNFQSKDDIPQNQHPLTVREKYVLAYHQTVDFSAHFGNLFQAALQQASNGQPHYGQGWGPYAERFGAAEADQVTSAFFIFGFLPHILHDDPRYFRKGKGSVLSRIKYSASRTVITRTDAGHSTFNVPQVAGQLLQQSISTAYYPSVDRSASGVFQNWGVNLAYNSAYNVLKEFYPDFLRIVFHRHAGQQSDPAPPPSTPAARPANP